jgi:hypothetical protein
MSDRKVPSLRHHNARGLAVVTLGGKDFYCGRFGSRASRREYDRLVGEWLAAGRPQRLTMAELLVRYMEYAKGYYLPPSREIEGITLALRPLKQNYGHTLAADFGPLSLRAVRDGWIRAGLARKHINSRVGKIRRLFKFAVSHKLVPPGVLDGLRAVEPLTFGHTAAVESPPREAVDEAVFLATLLHPRRPSGGTNAAFSWVRRPSGCSRRGCGRMVTSSCFSRARQSPPSGRDGRRGIEPLRPAPGPPPTSGGPRRRPGRQRQDRAGQRSAAVTQRYVHSDGQAASAAMANVG